MIRTWLKSFVLAAALALAACGGDNGGGAGGGDGGTDGGVDGGGGNSHTTHGRSWTVLVYMMADNNLEPFGVADMIEMARTGESENMRFVVQMDRSAGFSSDPVPGIGDWSGTKRILVRNGAFQVLEHLSPDPNMGAPNALADFIQWGVKKYPADRYALVLWDHGAAWPGFGQDESYQNDMLNLAELKTGISSGLAAANLKAFALIGFDACLMGTYEVAKALAPYGEYLLASEELEPGNGWDYESFKVIRDDPTRDPVALGKAIIDGYKAHSIANQQGASVTLSLTDLYALDDLTKAVNALAAEGSNQMNATNATVIARMRSESLKFGEAPDPRQAIHMVDLGDLITRLAGADGRFAAVKTQIDAGLSKAVLYKANGTTTQTATGLSIYFPPEAAYYQPSYDSLAEVASWRSFLKAYHASGSSSTAIPAFVNADHIAESGFDQTTGALIVRGTLSSGSAANVAAATFTYGIQTATGEILLLGDKPAQMEAQAGTVTGSWNLSVLSLTQGDNVAYGYLSIDLLEGGRFLFSIPFDYREPGEPGRLAIRQIVSDANGNVLQDIIFAEQNGGWGELKASPGATLMPLVQVLDASGNISWASGGETPFSADDLQANPIELGTSTIASGRAVFGMVTVENFGGKGDYVYAIEVTP